MDLWFFIGALVPTFIVSRVALYATRSWPGGSARLFACNGVSWLVCAFLAGMGMADGGAFAGVQAALSYGLPQGLWLALDLWRQRRRRAQPEATA